MNIQTSKILIDNITKDIILEKWNQPKTEFYKTNQNNLILRMPIKFRTYKNYISIHSKLVIQEKSKGVLMRLNCNFNKPIIISLLIGILPSLFLFNLYSNFLLFLFSTIVISAFSFSRFLLNISTSSEEYLNKFKENNS